MSMLQTLLTRLQGQSAPTQKQESLPDNSNTAPAATAQAAAAATSQATNPLDAVKNLWQQPQQSPQQASQGYFPFDMGAIQKTASGLDFSSLITPEHSQAIAAGGEGAVKAIAELLNNVGRASVAASVHTAGSAYDQGLSKFRGDIDSSIPKILQQQQASLQLRAGNDILRHPAISPVADAVTKQMQAQFPDATPQEIAEATKEYLQQVGSVFSSQTANPAASDSKPAVPGQVSDWEALMEK